MPQDWLLDIGLDHLTLARAALFSAMLRGEAPPADHVNEAVDVLRRAGAQHDTPSRPPHPRALARRHGRLRGRARGSRRGVRDRRAGADDSCISPTSISTARACSASSLAARPPIPGPRPKPTSPRRASSSRPAATAAAAKNSRTPRRRSSGCEDRICRRQALEPRQRSEGNLGKPQADLKPSCQLPAQRRLFVCRSTRRQINPLRPQSPTDSQRAARSRSARAQYRSQVCAGAQRRARAGVVVLRCRWLGRAQRADFSHLLRVRLNRRTGGAA